MEFTSAILMVLGIFIGTPFVLAGAIGGIYALSDRLAERAKRVQAEVREAAAEAEVEAPAKA